MDKTLRKYTSFDDAKADEYLDIGKAGQRMSGWAWDF